MGTQVDWQYIDDSARRPAGALAQRGYGGRWGAPPGHEPIFDAVLARLGAVAGERALDVGCGGGRLVERLLDAGAERVCGVDHSADVLALAHRRNDDAVGREVAEFRLADVSSLPWARPEFSLVVSTNAFFFFDEPLAVLAEMRRVMCDGGRLAIATAPGPEPSPSVWAPAMRVYDDDRLAGLVREAGFDRVVVETDDGVQFAAATKEER